MPKLLYLFRFHISGDVAKSNVQLQRSWFLETTAGLDLVGREQNPVFSQESPYNCSKLSDFKKVGGFETARLWQFLGIKLEYRAFIK